MKRRTDKSLSLLIINMNFSCISREYSANCACIHITSGLTFIGKDYVNIFL